jgi:hypothetical protein
MHGDEQTLFKKMIRNTVKDVSTAVKPAKDSMGMRVVDAAKPLSGAKLTPRDRMPGQSPGWLQSERFKIPVQHTDGKTDGPDSGRPRPITYRSGGVVKNASDAVAPAVRFKVHPPKSPVSLLPRGRG